MSVSLLIESSVSCIDTSSSGLGLEAKRFKKKGAPCPLQQVRWLRVLVDEGNICANISETMLQARQLSAERRWIVTGTPTVHLNASGTVASDNICDGQDVDLKTVSLQFSEYREDLRRLSAMIAGFLGVKVSQMVGGFHLLQSQSSDEEALLNLHVVHPLCTTDSWASRWRSAKVLEQLLGGVIIRHR